MSLVESGSLNEVPRDRREPPVLLRQYPAEPLSVSAARRELTAFAAAAGASDEEIESVRLASSEALTNIVLYAYPDGAGMIHVTAWVTDGELLVMISDDGCGLQAGRESAGLGLGLALISQVSEELSVVDRSSGGIEVRMRFSVSVGAGRAGDRAAQARGSVISATRPASSRFSTTT